MPDTFTNQRPYYDVTFPTSGDGFSISGFRNAFMGLGFMDFIPLQPRAHAVPDMKIMVRGRDASSFFNPVYYGNADQRILFQSGDSPSFTAPSVNPRIDIVYLTPSGDIKIQQGTEAVTPTLPSLAPSGDSRTPICAVYLKPTMVKILAFENRNTSTGDGYIYSDLRPWLRTAGAGAISTYGTQIPTNPTGDVNAGPGTSSAVSRADHIHAGVHGIRLPGQSLMQGDVEFAGVGLTQSGNRITIPSPTGRLLSITTFTSTGANTWTRPAGCTQVLVDVVGGGGGGQGGSTAKGGGSGGGGGWGRKFITNPGASESVTVGAKGGAGSAGGGADGGDGGDGGSSSFGSWVSATGGGGSKSNAGGTAGAGSSGDINVSGGTGANQGTIITVPTASGGDAAGGFGPGAGGIISGVGKNGSAYGGGGSGGSGNNNGGTGGDGIVIVYEYA